MEIRGPWQRAVQTCHECGRRWTEKRGASDGFAEVPLFHSPTTTIEARRDAVASDECSLSREQPQDYNT